MKFLFFFRFGDVFIFTPIFEIGLFIIELLIYFLLRIIIDFFILYFYFIAFRYIIIFFLVYDM